MMRPAIALFCLLITASATCAQEPNQSVVRPYQGVVRESFADVVKKQTEIMRVTIGMNFTLSGVSDPIGDDAKLRDRTRRSIYQMAVKECELLLEAIASECRIEGININLNLNRNPQIPDGINVNASVTLRAVQKQAGQ